MPEAIPQMEPAPQEIHLRPSWLMPLALALFLTYGLDAVRGWLLQTILPLRVEIALLTVFMFVMLWFGSWVFFRVERRVRTLGIPGQH